MKNGHHIVKTIAGEEYVTLILANGVEFTVASNPGYVNCHFSRINLDSTSGGDNIHVANQAANELNISHFQLRHTSPCATCKG